MKFIPKLFSTSMVQAIMAGNKTQTRRTDGLKSVNLPFIDGAFTGWQDNPTIAKLDKKGEIIPQECIGRYAEFDMGEWLVKCPYEVGDIIWVRETFVPVLAWSDGKQLEDPQYAYRANTDAKYEEVEFKWKPGIHMPKSACRLFLEIKSIRIERLNEISHEDCIAEGIEKGPTNLYRNYISRQDRFEYNPWLSFMSLWISINGTKSYDSSPYVWVIEFEKCEKPDNFF